MQGLAVAKIPGGQAVDSDRNPRLCASIRQLRQPIVEEIFSGAADEVANLYHGSIVIYKLHDGKHGSG
jgi:hypothetical protein